MPCSLMLFIDSTVKNYQSLLAAIEPNMRVPVLHPTRMKFSKSLVSGS
ncbi:hypothetical protein [Egbenema bharatensis]